MGSATTQVPWGATWLRDLRVAAGLTQERLAERAGLAVRSIRDLERGAVRRPRQETLRLIGQALDLEPAAAEQLDQAFRGSRAERARPLAATDSAGRAQFSRSPAELPRDVSLFVGRDQQLHTLRACLAADRAGTDAPSVLVVSGPGGFGKTTLAVHAAHQCRETYPDGQVFISLGGLRSDSLAPGQAQFEILWALGVPDREIPRSPQARTRFLRTLTADSRLLLVLDDAADAAQVTDLLPSGPANAVVVTSRSPLADLDATTYVSVGAFARSDSVTLLSRSVGDGRAPEQDGAWSRLAALCGDSPLALRISAARLLSRDDWTVTDLAARLEQEQTRLSFLDYGVLGMRACLNVSVQALRSPDSTPSDRDQLALSLFCRLSRLPGRDFAVETVAAIADRDPAEVEAAIDRLLDVQLLQSRATDRVSYHDLTLLYAREMPNPPDTEPDYVRLGTYYATNVIEIARVFGNTPENTALVEQLRERPHSKRDVFDWFRDEVAGVSEYVTSRAAASREEYELCRLIVQSIWVLLEHTKLGNIRDNAVAAMSEAAKVYDDPFTRIWCERQLSFAHANAGDLETAQAHLARAEEILPEVADDPILHARAAGGLLSLRGIMSGMAGDLDAAISDLRAALRLLSRHHLQHRNHCLENLSYALLQAGQPLEAMRYHLRLLESARASDNVNGQILATQGIAEELGQMGKPQQAIRYAERALKLAEAARVPHRIFDALELVAQQGYLAGCPEKAAAAHDRASAVVNTQSPAAQWSTARQQKMVAAAREQYYARQPEPRPAVPAQRSP